jgi:glyoxylase I family protein
MSLVKGFHHYAIRAFDFDATLRFYTEGLGAARVFGWGEGPTRSAYLRFADGSHVEVFSGRTVAEPSEASLIHVCFASSDPDAAYAQAIAHGATPHLVPFTANPDKADRPWSIRLAFVKGLDGEIIEFLGDHDVF